MHLEEIELALLAGNKITYIRGGQPFSVKGYAISNLPSLTENTVKEVEIIDIIKIREIIFFISSP